MTSTRPPGDTGDASRGAEPARDDACTAAPQAGIGTHVGDAPVDVAAQPIIDIPALPHDASPRTRANPGQDDAADAGSNEADPVYDDRTDDRPAP